MILVYLELASGKISKGTLIALGAALEAKRVHGFSAVKGLLLGSEGLETVAAELSSYGLEEILWAEAPDFRHPSAPLLAEAVASVAREIGASLILGLDSSQGKDFFPRVARAFDAGQVSSCVTFLDGKRYRRPMYAGNILAEVEVTSSVSVVTVRGSAFEPASKSGASAPVRKLSLSLSSSVSQEFIGFHSVASARPELTEAEVVVSGGRALKSAENFEKYILPLADSFGGAVGASRAAVDSGYAPNDWQVGQTGKIVAPKLYVAVGISGAIQHLAGMKDSKVIVAINKDPEAPIFEVADFGLVADLFEVVPQLTEAVLKAKGG